LDLGRLTGQEPASDEGTTVTGRKSAIVVPIRLPAALRAIMLRESATARLGVPAHVTLLFPFVSPPSISPDVRASVARVIGGAPAFDVAFRVVRRFEPGEGAPNGVVWLAPEPAAPFLALIDRTWKAFPDYPPYGGAFDEVIPHLTLADDDGMRMDLNEAEAGRHLPFRRRVTRAALIVEGADGRWRTRRRFPLRG
jgi:2'-5' RNA ligase